VHFEEGVNVVVTAFVTAVEDMTARKTPAISVKLQQKKASNTWDNRNPAVVASAVHEQSKCLG
jgi:hypothetical protein